MIPDAASPLGLLPKSPDPDLGHALLGDSVQTVRKTVAGATNMYIYTFYIHIYTYIHIVDSI